MKGASNRGARRRGTDRVLAYVAPALLVLVAAVHLVRVDRLDQSTWSGFGFGMFATIDSEEHRVVRAAAIVSGDEVPVPVPGALRREAFELRSVPTERRAAAFAEALADAGALPEGSDQVIVEVWAADLERDPLALSIRLVRRVHVELVSGR